MLKSYFKNKKVFNQPTITGNPMFKIDLPFHPTACLMS